MDEKKPCKFCERLEWWKENSPKGENGLYTTFQVSLITKNAQERRRRVRYGNASCRTAEFLP